MNNDTKGYKTIKNNYTYNKNNNYNNKIITIILITTNKIIIIITKYIKIMMTVWLIPPLYNYN